MHAHCPVVSCEARSDGHFAVRRDQSSRGALSGRVYNRNVAMVTEFVRFAGPNSDRLATIFRALSHPVRLEIVQTLSESGEACCVDLTRHASLAQSTVSEHLRVLKEAGIIQACGSNPRSGYCINKEALVWLKQAVVAL
jgi:ArsR family transcriptional regulator